MLNFFYMFVLIKHIYCMCVRLDSCDGEKNPPTTYRKKKVQVFAISV